MNGEIIAFIKALQNTSIEKLRSSGGSSDAGKVVVVDENGNMKTVTLLVGQGEIGLDSSLSVSGAAADAKVVGDRFAVNEAEISEVNESLQHTLNGLATYDIISGYTNDKILDTSVGVGNTVSTTTLKATGRRHVIIDASEGENFIINGSGASSARLWCFVDSDYKILSVADANVSATDLRVIAPANASKLIIQNLITAEDSYRVAVKDIPQSEGEINLFAYPMYTGWANSTRWVQVSGTAKHVVIPVKFGQQVTVTTNSANFASCGFVASYTSPTTEDEALTFIEGVWQTAKSTTETRPVPPGANYLVFNIRTETEYFLPASVSITDIAPKVATATFGTPFAVLSNQDEDATELDARGLTCFNIIQQSDNMYYMYYSAWNSDGPGNGYSENFLFAYSTDGINYTRGFPNGITAPFEGTNRLFSDSINITGAQVFKCCDPTHPYRLICQHEVDNANHICMYKSADGINFDLTTKRTLRTEYHDTQNVAVVRGSVLKIFFRENMQRKYAGGPSTHKSREISVMYFDLDGNLLCPEQLLPLHYIYNSAASPISDHEELIVPTHFDNSEESQDYSVSAYIVDGYTVSKVSSNLDSIFTSDDKWVQFMPGLITINNEQYMGIRVQNTYHDDTETADASTYVTENRLVKVTLAF